MNEYFINNNSPLHDIWSIIGTIAAIIFPLATILVLIYQISKERLALGIEILIKYEERFNEDEFHQLRKKAIISIENGKFEDAEEVYDFFETIGLLLRKKAVNKEFIWSTFSYWIIRYWRLSHGHIKKYRTDKHDDTYWSDFEFLYRRMIKMDKRKGKINTLKDLHPSYKDLEKFKEEEC